MERTRSRTRLIGFYFTLAMVILVTGGSLLRSAPPSAAPSAPPSPSDKIDYATAIRPIFEANCAKCHLNGVRKGRWISARATAC